MVILTYFLLVFIPHAASLTFNFTKFDTQNIVTDGNADIGKEGIQLTQANFAATAFGARKAGRARYVKWLHLWDKNSGELASFDTSFVFYIAEMTSTSKAEGLTFFLAEDYSMPTVGNVIGLPVDNVTNVMTSPFVAMEFDTRYDTDVDQPSDCVPHIGIDINNLVSVTYKDWPAGWYGGYNSVSIKYDSIAKNLSVILDPGNDDEKIELHYIIDLRVVLPEWVIFGFTAATGNKEELNIVTSWSFNSSELEVDKERSQPPPVGPKESTTQNTIPVTDPVKRKNRARQTAGIIGVITGVLACIAIFLFFLWRRKKNKGEEKEEVVCDVQMEEDFEMGTGPKRFSYHEMVQATDNFIETNKLGEGGFGGVYKGFLKDLGAYIAVKRVSKTSGQGIKEYMSEVKIISRLRHKNLVELKGWCHEKNELLLVYEFMENGSLDYHLFKGKSLLAWDIRYKIAHGLASVLLYLQEDCKECVLHRDIKSSNVMLDLNFNPKLGDFGLAKLVDHEKGSQTTMLAGTMGYMAPEYIMAGKASKESDVYSFGIVALEIASGRESIKNKVQERERKLLEWVWDLYGTDTLLEAVDPRLGSNFSEEELKRLMIVGLWCAHPLAASRPSMREAIRVLNFEASVPILPLKIPKLAFYEPPVFPYDGDASSSGSNTRSSKLTTSSSCSSSPSALLFNQT